MKHYYLLDVARTLHAQIVVQADSEAEALEAFARTRPEVLESVEDLWNPMVWAVDDDPRELTHLGALPGDARCFTVEAPGLVDIGSVWDVTGGDEPAGMPATASAALAKPWDVEVQP